MEFSLDSFNKWNITLKLPINDIDIEVFREIVCVYRKVKSSKEGSTFVLIHETDICELSLKVCDQLLAHLKYGFRATETQTLCTFAMCSLINVLPTTYHYLYVQEIHDIFKDYIDLNCEFSCNSLDSGSDTTQYFLRKVNILSIVNGIFQSDLILNDYYSKGNLKFLSEITIQKSLQVVIRSCMKYSDSTYSAFKNMALIMEKFVEWKIKPTIFNDLYQSVSYIILYNWENLLSGIKELNSKVLRSFLIFSDKYYLLILEQISRMPWNKAKYFTLSEITFYLHSNLEISKSFYESCIQGLNYSLKNPLMVSAGKDLYKVLLQTFAKYEDWKQIFYGTFIESLKSDNRTVKMNILKYWLTMTLKKYPILLKDCRLLKDLEPVMNYNTLVPFLFILKIGRKNGQLLNDWSNINDENIYLKKILSVGLLHIDIDVRSQAIEVICCSPKNTIVPSDKEFKVVQSFLISNINEDSTAFRQTILNSYTSLLVRTRDSYLHHIKHNSVESTHNTFKMSQEFCAWLCNFLICNLCNSGNYQRKISSLKIFEITLNYLSNSSDFNSCRKSNQRDQGWKFKEFLIHSNKWFFETHNSVTTLLNCIYDTTNDIRELALAILIKYFVDHPALTLRKNEFFIGAIVLCNSKLFYEVESGVLILKLLFSFNGTLNQSDIPILQGSEGSNISVLEFIYNKAWENFVHHSKDPFFSICNNQPMYGLILAINAYLKYSKNVVTYQSAMIVLNFVKDVTFYFLNNLAISCKNKTENYSPSFQEMSESIDFIISQSNYKLENDETDQFQISNAHHLVLNNTWLNLKACSELSSTIVEKFFDSLLVRDLEKCIGVNIAILSRCRHKGAIESAGLYLGRSVKHITTHGNCAQRELLATTLENVISEVTSPNASGASITRKSAGLTILVHRFVTNDSDNAKTLFTSAILKIIQNLMSYLVNQGHTFDRGDDFRISFDSQSVGSDDNESNKNDIPQARAIHLLCRTVADYSLSQYIIHFASSLSTICFEYFNSDNWLVRNAALQLYGALIPKLVGQKIKDADDTMSESAITIDELFAHMPILGNIIFKIFKINNDINSREKLFKFHSSLIPILSLFSSMAKRYNTEYNLRGPHLFLTDVDELFQYLKKLLCSQLYVVRSCAAKAIELFYDIQYFYDHCRDESKATFQDPNTTHGYYLVMKNHLKYYNCVKKYMPRYWNHNFIVIFNYTLDNIVAKAPTPSFVQASLLLEILSGLTNRINSGENYVKALARVAHVMDIAERQNSSYIGAHIWVHTNIYYALTNCGDVVLPCVLSYCIDNFNERTVRETILPTLIKRFSIKVPNGATIIDEIINKISKLKCKNNTDYQLVKMIFEIFYRLMESAPIDVVIMHDHLFMANVSLYNEIYDIRKCGYLIPFITLVASRKFMVELNKDLLKPILDITISIISLLKLDECNYEMKSMAVIALKNLANVITFLWRMFPSNDGVYEIKVNILLSIFWLLQDEDIEIRYQCSNISFFDENFVSYPSNQITHIFSKAFLHRYFNEDIPMINRFLKFLIEELPKANTEHVLAVPNPFDHHVKNIYLEPEIVKNFIEKLMH